MIFEAAIAGLVLGLVTQRRALLLALLAALAAGRTWFVSISMARFGDPWSDGAILISAILFWCIASAAAIGACAWRARRQSKAPPKT